MSKLEELIKEFCPNGVEYKPLWSLTAWDKRFNGIDRSMQKKVVSYKYYLSSEFNEVERRDGDILYIPTGITNEKRYTTEELAGEYLAEGEIVCIPWGGTPNVKYHKGKFVTGDNRIATSLDTDILDNKYLYYWMQSKIDLIASFYRGAGIQHPSMKSVLELQIPLPALPVQREIVRILDSFTLYSAELTAELTARRKQYEFYRDKLLKFDIRVQRKTIEEIAFFRRGSFPQPYTNGAFYGGVGAMPFVQVADVAESGFRLENATKQTISLLAQPKSVFVHAGTIICSLQGSIGRVAIAQYDCYVDRTLAIFESFKIPINKKYFAYSIDRKFNYEKNFARGSTIKTITKEEFSKFEIPVPPIDVQERIVKVLDNFDAICSDLGIGLPAEIEKRQKQYEYYREKLLTFDGKYATILTERNGTERNGTERNGQG